MLIYKVVSDMIRDASWFSRMKFYQCIKKLFFFRQSSNSSHVTSLQMLYFSDRPCVWTYRIIQYLQIAQTFTNCFLQCLLFNRFCKFYFTKQFFVLILYILCSFTNTIIPLSTTFKLLTNNLWQYYQWQAEQMIQ